MAITKQDFEYGKAFCFEFQEGEDETWAFQPMTNGDAVGIINIDDIDSSSRDIEVVSIHTNYAILQFQKFDKKYNYKVHFQNCNLI